MSPPVQPVVSDEKLPGSADVVVIGGGIAGSAAAYALAKKGLSVALLEKGRIAGEQTSRNWGWCRQQHRDLRELPLAMKSLEIWGELGRELGVDPGFRRTGLVYVTTRPADLAPWEAWTLRARDHQMHSRVLSGAEAKAMTPGSTADWIGGVHSPTDGRAEPGLAGPAIAEGARRLGVTIHQDCAARGLVTEAGKVSASSPRGLHPHPGRAVRGRRLELAVLPPARRPAAAGQRAFHVFRHCGRTGGDRGRPVDARRHDPPPARWRLHRRPGRDAAGSSSSPQGLLYARQFWPTFKKRRWGLTFAVGRSFFEGPEAFSRWSLDGISPFERQRTLDPPADRRSWCDWRLTRLGEHYPALAGLQVAQAWGGRIDFHARCDPGHLGGRPAARPLPLDRLQRSRLRHRARRRAGSPPT